MIKWVPKKFRKKFSRSDFEHFWSGMVPYENTFLVDFGSKKMDCQKAIKSNKNGFPIVFGKVDF